MTFGTLKPLGIVLVALTVHACSGGEVKRTLGLAKAAPDEFMVISRPPLNIPPDFSLNPPSEDTDKVSTASLEAKQLLFPPGGASTGATTPGETSLLQQAGAQGGNSNIRDILKAELKEEKQIVAEESFLDSFRHYFTPRDQDPVVDTDREEERLDTNAKEGKPVNDGEVPTNKNKEKKSLIDQMLGSVNK